MFTMCNFLFVVYYYLFVMFNFFVRRHNYLFVLLKYLFPVAEINNQELKKNKILKYRAKYRQV